MSDFSFYFKIVKALEEIEAPYMIVGAFAGLAFGVSRATFDVDILVNLSDADITALTARFPPPRYYADPEMMRNSTRRGTPFNIIDTTLGVKADLVPVRREPDVESAFARRIRQTFQDERGETFTAWYAHPTDIIIGKLKAWTEGRSTKHPSDIHAMVVFALSGLSDTPLDVPAIAAAAARMGPDTAALWHALFNRAQAET